MKRPLPFALPALTHRTCDRQRTGAPIWNVPEKLSQPDGSII